ncbi:MAG: nitroreductase family protein [Chitinophagaceae bacterium]|nr:nitroreductase family protein [Chitinophagaceae bacterium]
MNTFEYLQSIIRQRRSIKPADMNGSIIDESQLRELFELADWAPTHGRTEPWRFIVYGAEAKKQFCLDHAALYQANTSEEKFNQGKFEKLQQQGDTLSHIVIAYMKRTTGHTIPPIEETAATAAAIENFLLGAAALGIAALWSTGGMTHHPSMKEYLGLGDEDLVLGLLMLGYSDKPAVAGKRNIPVEQKVVWK